MRILALCILLAATACTSPDAPEDSPAISIAKEVCQCQAVKDHLALVEEHNERADSSRKAAIKLLVPQSAAAMDSTCLGHFRQLAAQAHDKARFQRTYAKTLHQTCPNIAKGLHVPKPQ